LPKNEDSVLALVGLSTITRFFMILIYVTHNDTKCKEKRLKYKK